MGGAALPVDEPTEYHQSEAETRLDGDRPGTPLGPHGQAVGEHTETDRAESGPADVEPSCRRAIAGLRHVADGEDEHHDHHGHVEHKDPPPRRDVDQPPTEKRPGGAGDAGKAGPSPDGTGAVFGAERRLQERQRRRCEQCGTDPLQRAEDHEHAHVRGHGTGQRGRPEPRQADDEDTSSTEAIPQRSPDQDERRQRQGIGVDRPGQSGAVGVQVATDGGQRDVDHGRIEERDRGPQHRRGQNPPAGGIAVAEPHRRGARHPAATAPRRTATCAPRPPPGHHLPSQPPRRGQPWSTGRRPGSRAFG